MAEKTLAFTEVKHLNASELNKLRKMKYAEMWWHMNDFFCVSEKEVKKFEYMYAEIIPCCQKITTADNVEVYVAKIKRHVVCTEPRLHAIMKEHYGAIDECYLNVTDLGGERFNGLRYINWAVKDKMPEKCSTLRIPKMRPGSTLFYVAC